MDGRKGHVEVPGQQPAVVHLALEDPVVLDHNQLGLAAVVGVDSGDLRDWIEG